MGAFLEHAVWGDMFEMLVYFGLLMLLGTLKYVFPYLSLYKHITFATSAIRKFEFCCVTDCLSCTFYQKYPTVCVFFHMAWAFFLAHGEAIVYHVFSWHTVNYDFTVSFYLAHDKAIIFYPLLTSMYDSVSRAHQPLGFTVCQ